MNKINSTRFVQLIRELPNFYDTLSILQSYGVTSYSDLGNQYVMTCPWHEDYVPSFRINKNNGIYHCFSCGRSGTLLKLMHRLSGSSTSVYAFADNLLKENTHLARELGFNTIYSNIKEVCPEFQHRRIFHKASAVNCVPLTTLVNTVRAKDDSFAGLATSLSLLQVGMTFSEVYNFYSADKRSLETEELLDINELLLGVEVDD